MRLLAMFLILLAILVLINISLLGFAYMRSILYKSYVIVADVESMVNRKIFDLPPNSLVRINISNSEVTSITVQSGVYSDGYVHIVVEPSTTCVALTSINMSSTELVCGSGTVPPGRYFIEATPSKPTTVSVEETFSWLPMALVVVIVLVLTVMLAYTRRR